MRALRSARDCAIAGLQAGPWERPGSAKGFPDAADSPELAPLPVSHLHKILHSLAGIG